VTYFVTKSAKQKITILQGVQGFFEPGKVTAVVSRPHSRVCAQLVLCVLVLRGLCASLHGAAVSSRATQPYNTLYGERQHGPSHLGRNQTRPTTMCLECSALSEPVCLPSCAPLLAQLGHSGSGKTTLLDVLASRKTSGTLTGTIQYNGLRPSSSLMRRITGYVEQVNNCCRKNWHASQYCAVQNACIVSKWQARRCCRCVCVCVHGSCVRRSCWHAHGLY
jgi:hypothetical protein